MDPIIKTIDLSHNFLTGSISEPMPKIQQMYEPLSPSWFLSFLASLLCPVSFTLPFKNHMYSKLILSGVFFFSRGRLMSNNSSQATSQTLVVTTF